MFELKIMLHVMLLFNPILFNQSPCGRGVVEENVQVRTANKLFPFKRLPTTECRLDLGVD
jgi:hypothetical protein